MPESGDFFGPLALGDLETPEKRGKFINIEAIDAYIEKATMVDITVSGTSTLNDVTINDATIDSATITNADIDELTYDKITAGTNPNTLTHSGDFVVSGSISLSGDLTLESTGVFATASSGARIEIDNGTFGAERMTFYSGAAGEYAAARIESVEATPVDGAFMSIRGPNMGDATNSGYGGITIDSYDDGDATTIQVEAIGDGVWGATANLLAVNSDSGDVAASVVSSANTGDATATITAGSNSGTSKVNISGDSIEFFGQIWADDSLGASAPAYSFDADENTGMYRAGSDIIGFATSGTEQAVIGATALRGQNVTGSYRLLNAGSTSASTPTYNFNSDTDTGMYRPAANQIGFATGASRRLLIDSGVVVVEAPLFRLPTKGTTGDPTATDQGDMYVNTVDNVLKVYEGGSWRTVASW